MKSQPLARLLWLLLPVLCVGLFARVYYTPDEPREASLVVAMASQADKSLPELAGRPFAEKPPLLYWLGGGAVAVLGAEPGVARLPNLLYALLALGSIVALATRAAGRTAGYAAGIALVTTLQLYQGLIWLATDAPLIGGVALALYGMHRGLVAQHDSDRLRGYLALYAGLAIAFFAKGFAGWMVPVLAMLSVIAAERRWREIIRPALWAGLPLLMLAIGAWVWAVSRRPEGPEALRVLFWYNLVGRAVAIDAPQAYSYATGHANSPAKYLLELPMYLLPWTFIALAAVRRAWARVRAPDAIAWRLAVGAIVPATVLLSFAATARGVYYTPPLLGFALLVGLYVAELERSAPDRWDLLAFRLTAVTIALLASVLGLLAAAVCWAPTGRGAVEVAGGAIALAAAGAAALLAIRTRGVASTALPRQALATALILTLVLGPLYLRLNDWLSLEATAVRVRAASGHAPLLLLAPDETTVALAGLYLPGARVADATLGGTVDAAATAQAALSQGARILWLVPDRRRWKAAQWLAFLGYRPAVGVALNPPLPAGIGPARVECVIERAGGRAYLLLAAADAAPLAGTLCR